MKVTVVGLGAVGGLIAARLARTGSAVHALARGSVLAAVRTRGLGLDMDGTTQWARIHASDDARDFGPQDLVIVALKSQHLAPSLAAIAPLLGPQTVVMPAMNGVPWWFMLPPSAGSALQDRRLRSVDPLGQIEAAWPVAQVLGCVVHLTCASPEPGLVRHGFGQRLIVGEPAGGESERARQVCGLLAGAGFQAELSADVRMDIWYKLWGNMTMNPVSALTGATSDRILDDPLVRSFMVRAMTEAAQIGARIGCPITQSGDERLEVARPLGAFRTSMLQDVQAGRGIELDALVTVVHEIGTQLQVPMPSIDALLGLTRLMARQQGLYPT